jgi:hypothetical protein
MSQDWCMQAKIHSLKFIQNRFAMVASWRYCRRHRLTCCDSTVFTCLLEAELGYQNVLHTYEQRFKGDSVDNTSVVSRLVNAAEAQLVAY